MIHIIASFIREWLKEIVVLFVIITLVELLIPKGNMKRYVNFIVGIIIVFTIINPFTKLINLEINLDKEIETFSNNIVSKEGVVEKQNKQIEEIFKKNLSYEIERIVADNTSYRVRDVNVVTKPDKENIFVIENVRIKLDDGNESINREIKVEKIQVGNDVIPVDKNNYDYEEVKSLILTYLQIDENKLVISFDNKEDKYGRNN